MKWMIASDIHGSAYYCEKMSERFTLEGADRLVLLGDLLYHGPRNDLPSNYAPKSVIKILNGMKESLLCVRGNCDCEVDAMVLDFPMLADFAVIETGGKLIYLTHGHIYNEDNPLPMMRGDVLIHGHTHVPLCEERGGRIFMNPGSLSIPKENSPHGYMTLEDGLFLWKDIDGAEYKSFSLA